MVKRRAARELALKVLYAVDVGRADPGKELDYAALSEYLGKGLSPETLAFCRALVTGTIEATKDIDDRIRELAREWSLWRMAAVDRNVLRIAVFEMLNLPDVPYSVSINEAVELAKKYGTEESGRFVNGILGSLARGLPPKAEPRLSPGSEGEPEEGEPDTEAELDEEETDAEADGVAHRALVPPPVQGGH